MFDELNQVPSFLQPNRPKQLTLEELRNERKRLEEIQRINKLKMNQAESYKQQQAVYNQERAQKIQNLKTVGGGIVNVFKGGMQKVSEFDKSRMNAKPLINKPSIPGRRKSIYD
jgi:hypothetical protein